MNVSETYLNKLDAEGELRQMSKHVRDSELERWVIEDLNIQQTGLEYCKVVGISCAAPGRCTALQTMSWLPVVIVWYKWFPFQNG